MTRERMEKALLLIVCDGGACEQVIEEMRKSGLTRYTVHHGALGVGETGRHEGTATWPGQNTIIFSCIEQDQVAPLVEGLKALHDCRGQHTLGLKLFALSARELL